MTIIRSPRKFHILKGWINVNKPADGVTLGPMKHQKHGRNVIFLRPGMAVILTLILLFSGCNALKRGDLKKQIDDTTMFRSIGFSIADNPELSRDAITTVSGFSTEITITIPYYRGDLPAQPLDLTTATGTPLIINYSLVAKDAFVEYMDSSSIWHPATSGETAVPFHDGGVFDLGTGKTRPVQFRVGKQEAGSGSVNYTYYNIYCEKIITPKILNPLITGPAVPSVTLELAFVDENGTAIPVMSAADPLESSEIEYNHNDIRGIAGPTPDSGPPERYLIDIQPLFPGKHKMRIPDFVFADALGYFVRGGELNFFYDPPAVHLSHNGNDGNTGFAPDEAVETWARALDIIEAGGIFSVRIEASSTPYDIIGYPFIDDSPITYLGVYGGYKPGFTDRYKSGSDTEPRTILYNSSQGNGANELSPSSTLQIDSVTNNFIFEQLDIAAKDNTSASTAVLLTSGAAPLFSDVSFVASQGNGSSAGLTVINSSPVVKQSRIVGKNGGTGKSMGLRINNNSGISSIELRESFVLGGDTTDICHGIYATYATGGSNLLIEGTVVISGFIDSAVDTYSESTSRALFAENSYNIDIQNSWFHSSRAVTETNALSIVNNDGLDHIADILNSTLIADRSNSPCGLSVQNTAGGENDFNLFNSVLLVDRSDSLDALGIKLTGFNGMDDLARISSNAIKVGASPSATVGIEAVGSPDLEIHNNLVWSDQTNSLIGISSSLDISDKPIRYNDFWDTDGKSALKLDSGLPATLASWHSLGGLVTGNICMSVPVDTTYSYSSEDFDVGRITGASNPDDVIYGGEYLWWLTYDRDGQTRSTSAMVGCTMGPYEQGSSGYLPPYIHVSPDGDDGNPLGTAAKPFATLTRAYDLARVDGTGRIRTDVIEIRVAEGDYDLSAAPSMPMISNAYNISFRGGYDLSFGTRNPSAYVSLLYRSGASTLLVFNSSATDATFEGFTLDNSAATGSPIAVQIDGLAHPLIQNNRIISGDGTDTRGFYITGSAYPVIDGNTIEAGDAGTGQSYGIFLLNAGYTSITSNDIQGGSGGLVRGLHVQNTRVDVIGNTIRAGDASSDAIGLYLLSNPGNTEIRNNTILGGSTTAAGISRGMYVNNTSGDIKIAANKVFGGESLDSSTGIELNSASNTVLMNNLIHAGAPVTNTIRGVDVINGSTLVWLYNNTVYGGRSSGSTSEAIKITGSAAPNVMNNIIISGQSTMGSKGFREEAGIVPTQFLNNLIHSYNDPLATDVPYQAVAGMMDANTIETHINGAGGIASGNKVSSLTENPAVYFIKFTYDGGESEFLTDSWRLSGSGLQSPKNSGYNLSGVPNYPFTTDFAGASRNNPWSVGAYEY
jgi:hypothetical protein